MKYIIREMQSKEYFLLEDFIYEANSQRDEVNLLPKSIINKPKLQPYVNKFREKRCGIII